MTRALCCSLVVVVVFFYSFVHYIIVSFSLGFFSGVKNSNPKEKVGRPSSSAGSLVAICS